MTYRLTVDLPQLRADHLAEALLGSAVSVGAFDRGDGLWSVEAFFVERPTEAELNRAYALAGLGAAAERVRITRLGRDDFAGLGLDGLAPLTAGPFRVFGPHNVAASAGRATDLVVDAGGAFGDGWHPSTRLALSALDLALRRGRPRRILDLGTGAGTLAAAAARRAPAARLIATDIDHGAVAVARRTLRLNGVAPRATAVAADGLRHPAIAAAAPFDLVLANILPGPLVRLGGDVAAATRPGGAVVLSGLRIGEVALLRAAYAARGLILATRFIEAEWAALLLRRPVAAASFRGPRPCR